MAGSKVNDYAIGDQNIQSVMLTLDAQRYGFCSVSLTNYDNTNEPAIAAGSKVEINGSLYKFDSEEAIGGSESSGTNYIVLIPSGDSVTAEYTDTAPTWSDSKHGWYGTGDNANNRYIAEFWYYDSGYYLKYVFTEYDIGKFKTRFKTIAIGSWDMDTSATKSVSFDYGGDFSYCIVALTGIIYPDYDEGETDSAYGTPYSGGVHIRYLLGELVLSRTTSGNFDYSGFDSTAINRGYILIAYDLNL